MKKELDYKAMWEKLYEFVNERTHVLHGDIRVAFERGDRLLADVIEEQLSEVYDILKIMLAYEEGVL